MPLLEQRDGYFTKLKAAIEGAHKLHKEKVSSLPLAVACKMFKAVHFLVQLVALQETRRRVSDIEQLISQVNSEP